MDKEYDSLTPEVKSEITREAWNGLLKLKGRLKGNGWTKLRFNKELSTKELFVIEAISPPPSNHKHWFQISMEGDITPRPTYMRCK